MSDIDIMEPGQDLAAAFEQLPGEAATYGAPAVIQQDRAFGAQKVAVVRDEAQVMRKLKALGGAVGEDWYYRFPVRSGGQQKFIEGPSIKLANDLARIYGNCEVDTRVQDSGDSWIIYARFTDFETGYALTRPFQQRKNQSSVRGDADRQRDIAFQIGVSKAIRNVVCNALQTHADFAFREAKKAIIETVGKNLDQYRVRCAERFKELGIDQKRVEAARGKPISEWIAQDVAITIGELKSITDGMATATETYPAGGQEEARAPRDLGKELDKLGSDGEQAKQERSKPSGSTAARAAAEKTIETDGTKTKDRNGEIDNSDPIREARRAGREDAEAGKAKRQMPARFRNDDVLSDAYVEGFDSFSPNG